MEDVFFSGRWLCNGQGSVPNLVFVLFVRSAARDIHEVSVPGAARRSRLLIATPVATTVLHRRVHPEGCAGLLVHRIGAACAARLSRRWSPHRRMALLWGDYSATKGLVCGGCCDKFVMFTLEMNHVASVRWRAPSSAVFSCWRSFSSTWSCIPHLPTGDLLHVLPGRPIPRAHRQVL